MSQVIYARVPDEVKEAADGFAEDHGMTLTSAVVELLERGLASTSDEHSVQDLQAKLQKLRNEIMHVQGAFEAAKSQLDTLRTLAQRATQPVGSCPNASCQKPITGLDLLANGHCHNCGQALTDLLNFVTPSSPSAKAASTPGSLNDRDMLLLLGTLGALAGVVFLSSKK